MERRYQERRFIKIPRAAALGAIPGVSAPILRPRLNQAERKETIKAICTGSAAKSVSSADELIRALPRSRRPLKPFAQRCFERDSKWNARGHS